MSTTQVFGAVIAVILLFGYAYLVFMAVRAAQCGTPCAGQFTDGMASAMSLIGGLVGALVVATLALTKPLAPPAAQLFTLQASPPTLLTLTTWAYLIVWLLCGIAALVVSWRHPKEVPALTNLGQAWIGLAVAAGYAYFGLKPHS